MKIKETAVQFSNEELKLLRKVSEFLDKCTVEQAAIIVNEALMIHTILAFNPVTKLLMAVESVSINGDYIQLNIQEYEE